MELTMESSGRRSRVARALVAVAIAALVVLAPPARAHADPAGDASIAADMLNGTRAAYGLDALTPDVGLQVLANRQANAMAAAGFIYHQDLGTLLHAGWWGAGENVGYGPGVGWIHSAFMNSPHHASNILSGSFDDVGVGVAYGRDGTVYVAQVFGAW